MNHTTIHAAQLYYIQFHQMMYLHFICTGSKAKKYRNIIIWRQCLQSYEVH